MNMAKWNRKSVAKAIEKILHFFEGSDCENDDKSDKHLGRFEMKIILIRRKKRKWIWTEKWIEERRSKKVTKILKTIDSQEFSKQHRDSTWYWNL